jgi:hypothetical protein
MSELSDAAAALDEAEGVEYHDVDGWRVKVKLGSRPIVAFDEGQIRKGFESAFHPEDVERAIDELPIWDAIAIIAKSMGLQAEKYKASRG